MCAQDGRLYHSHPREVLPTDFDRYLTRKAIQGHAATTRRTRLHGLKTAFKFFASRGYIPSDPSLDVQGPKIRETRVPIFSQEEITRMIFGYTPPPLVQGEHENDILFARRKRTAGVRPIRDSALIGLGYTLGLRVAEFQSLQIENILEGSKRMFLELLHGKGGTIEKQEVDAPIAELLREYLGARARAGFRSPALFCPLAVSGSGSRKSDLPIGLDQRQVRRILTERCAAIGILATPSRKIHPHMLRYSLGTHLFENNVRIEIIQNRLRHRDIKTTRRYIRIANSIALMRSTNRALPWNRPKGSEED